MRFNLYVVYDEVAERYSPPFAAVTDGVARRNFRAFLERDIPKIDWDVYKMFYIGYFNDEAGMAVSDVSREIKYDIAPGADAAVAEMDEIEKAEKHE